MVNTLATSVNSADSGILDGFFWDVAAFVLILAFVDFYIGKDGRENIRERVGDWWLYVSDIPVNGSAARNAKVVRSFLLQIFGNKAFSLRRFGSVALYAWTILAFAVPVLAPKALNTGGFISAAWPIFAVSWVTENVALSVSLYSLKQMELRRHPIRVALLAFASLGLCIILAILVNPLITFLSLSLFEPGLAHGTLPQSLIPPSDVCTDCLYWAPGDRYNVLGRLIAAGSLLPLLGFSMLYFLFSCAVVLSRTLQPLLQKPLATLLLRFYESDKGVLTLLAASLGATAEVAHKAFTEGPFHY